MSDLKIVGKFIAKSELKQITDKFAVENFWIDIDGKYPTQAQFQVNNQAVQCDFPKGTEIEIHFNVQGRKWEKDDRSGFAQNLVAWKILDLSVEANVPQPAQDVIDNDILPF